MIKKLFINPFLSHNYVTRLTCENIHGVGNLKTK